MNRFVLALLLAGCGLEWCGLAARQQPTAEGSRESDAAWEGAARFEASDPYGAAHLAREALALDSGQLAAERVELAFRLTVALAETGDLGAAVELAEPLHAATRADWSAINLGLLHSRLGEPRAAERVLFDQLRASTRPGELWNHLALVAMGEGRESLARSRLGRAVRLGSRNAQLSLARLDLQSGRMDAARGGFRAGADAVPPGPWSLRGWALTLLPARP